LLETLLISQAEKAASNHSKPREFSKYDVKGANARGAALKNGCGQGFAGLSQSLGRFDRCATVDTKPVENIQVKVTKVCCDEGFSMRATAEGFGAGLTLARVDKPLKEEAVGC
jgi:hypothetical protein